VSVPDGSVTGSGVSGVLSVLTVISPEKEYPPGFGSGV
jgi:hypothetical protein